MKKSAKFERCVLAVKAKQPKRCKSQKWKGKGCLNVWAVCHASVDGASSETTCPICLEEFTDDDNNIVIACSNEHRFHKDCIEGWMSRENYECPLCKELITINMIKGTFYEKYIGDGYDGIVIKAKFSSEVEERDIKNGDIRITQEYCNIYHNHFHEDWNRDLNADTVTALDWDAEFPAGLTFNQKCRNLLRDNFLDTFYHPERYRLPENIYVDSSVWNRKMNKGTKQMFLEKFTYVYIITEFVEFAEDEGFEHFPESDSEESDSESDPVPELESEDGTSSRKRRKSPRVKKSKPKKSTKIKSKVQNSRNRKTPKRSRPVFQKSRKRKNKSRSRKI